MPFVTKPDLSDNRQAKQRPRTTTELSGTTVFGLPFSALTSGPDYSTEVITASATTLVSTFVTTSGVTAYNWGDPKMVLGEAVLSALTSSNSGVTQDTDSVYSAWTTTVIDGNLVVTSYSGVSFDLTVNDMVETTPNVFSGNTITNVLDCLSAGTLDFTGRTIWSDTKGISRTEKLIVSDNPTVGYVLTCTDSEGMVGWSSWSSSTRGVDRIDNVSAPTYTITTDYDTIFLDCTSNNITASLPIATGNGGRVFTVKRLDNSVNSCTLNSAGGHTIDNNVSLSLSFLDSITIISDASDWWIK